ncbi:hypothetical protein RUND412_000880 [Rhizina undulata]
MHGESAIDHDVDGSDKKAHRTSRFLSSLQKKNWRRRSSASSSAFSSIPINTPEEPIGFSAAAAGRATTSYSNRSFIIAAETKAASIESLPRHLLWKIFSFLPKTTKLPQRLPKDTLLNLSLVCRTFHSAVLLETFNSVVIRSPTELEKLETYFTTHGWIGQCSAIKKLKLCWPQLNPTVSVDYGGFAEAFGAVFKKSGNGIQELVLEFPGADEFFEKLIMRKRIVARSGELKKLVLKHAGTPMFPPSPFLLLAISLFAHHSLEELTIDGGCSSLNGPWVNNQRLQVQELEHPSRDSPLTQTRTFHSLRKLELAGVAGLTNSTLIWLLSGSKMRKGRFSVVSAKIGNILDLRLNPGIDKVGISEALELVGSGLDELRIVYLDPKMMPNCIAEHHGSDADSDAETVSHKTREKLTAFGSTVVADYGKKDREIHLCEVIRKSCPHLARLYLHTNTLCRSLLFNTPAPLFSITEHPPSPPDSLSSSNNSRTSLSIRSGKGLPSRANFPAGCSYTQLKSAELQVPRDDYDQKLAPGCKWWDTTELSDMLWLEGCDGEPAGSMEEWAQQALNLYEVSDYVRLREWHRGGNLLLFGPDE